MKKISILLAAVQLGLCLSIPVMAAEEDEIIKIEAENYTGSTNPSGITTGEFSNGEAATWYYTSPQEDLQYTLSYTFNVPTAGKYELKGVANVRGEAHTTDWYVYMNDEENAAGSYTKTADVSCNTFPGIMKEYSMGKFKLKKGLNTLYVKVDKKDLPTAHGCLIFMADYFTLEKTGTDAESFKLEKIAFQNSKLGVFEEGNQVKLDFTYSSYAPESIAYRFEIQDVYERDVASGKFTVEKGKDAATLNFGKFDIGWYRVYLYEDGSQKPMDNFISFAVTAPLSKRADFEDTAFAADIGYGGSADFIGAWQRAGFGYIRGRGSGPSAGGNPTLKRLIHEGGMNEMGDHDPGAILGYGAGSKEMTFDLYENSYKVWKAVPGANGYYEEAEEVLNEIDNGMWSITATPEDWVAYYKAAAIGIYDANPNALKVFGGLAAYDNAYIRQTMQNGILDYSDVYNYHAHSEYDIRPKKARMFANVYSDDPSIAMWGTEMGWPQRYNDGETKLTNAQMLNDARGPAITAVQQFANGSTKNFWFLATHYDENSQNFSCFSSENLPLPSYSAVSTLSYVLGQGKVKGEISELPEGATGYLFDDGLGNDVAVFWADNPVYVDLDASKVTYVDMVGYEKTKTDDNRDGKISVYVTPQPCYIKFSGRASESNYYPLSYDESDEVKAFEANDRIVIQPIWSCDDYSAARSIGYGYNQGDEIEVKLNVYNFNDCSMSGTIKVKAEDIITFEENEIAIDFEPWEKKEIVLKAKVSEERFPGEDGYVKFYGETSDGEEIHRSVSKVQISNAKRSVDLSDVVMFENIWDVNNWNLKNVSTGGKVEFEGKEAEQSAVFTPLNITWHFPQYKIDEPTALKDSAGIVFEIKSDADMKAAMGVGSFIHMKDGRQYYCGYGMTRNFSTEWEQVVLPWSVFTLYSSPLGDFDTRPFAFEDVASISIGASQGGAPSYTIKNFGYFYSDNPKDGFVQASEPQFEGLEKGGKYQSGDNLILKAVMPKNDYVEYKVLNRNQALDNYTIDGDTITMDFSNFKKGSYRIYVAGVTEYDECIIGTFDFYIE